MKRVKYILVVLVLSLTVLSGYSLPGLNGKSTRNDVKITTLSTSESQVISHMLRLSTEYDTHDKIKPVLVNNLRSSTVQHNALINGDANVSSVRYNGTDLTEVLKEAPIKDPKKAMIATQREFKEKFNQALFNLYGFTNTYAFMVTKETAKKYHLETVPGLAKHNEDLRLGMNNSWMNRKGDGYEGFKREYGFDFDTVRPMQIGLVYDALNSEKLDVILGYSADDRIAAYDLKVLKDDKRFFPPYTASTVATNESLRQHPELKTTVSKLTGKISASKVQRLNYEADGRDREPAVVTEEFLKRHRYFDKQKDGRK